jgi:hypothetical protein
MPRLKKKTELNYRPGPTSRSCNSCNHFVSESRFKKSHPDIPSLNKARCAIMGLGEGRRFWINPKYICDAHDNSLYLDRLKGAVKQ